jgi:hypothetical protein
MSWILHKVRQMRVVITTLLVVISSLSVAAAEQQQRASTMIDVALSSEGHLISRCEDTNGSPLGDAIVELVRERDMICWTTSRSDGSFTLRDVKPGIYRLQCGDCDRTIRVWADAAAPPAARVPIVVVVAAAPLPVPGAKRSPDSSADASPATAGGDFDAAAAADSTGDEQEPILQLQLQDGAQRKPVAAAQPALPIVAPPVAAAVLQIESNPQHTHAHHSIETAAVDVPFDPFAGTRFESPAPHEPEFVDLTEEPLTAPMPAQEPPASQWNPPPPAYQPAPQEVPPCGDVRYIRRSVGPTVGDVVVTSFGVAGITMGLIGIHKYENRKVRRVMSP